MSETSNSMKQTIISPSLFFQLDCNPMWIWLDQFGDHSKKEPISEFNLKIMENGNIHEKQYVSNLDVVEVKEIDPAKGVLETQELMRAGVSLIYQGWLEAEFDGLIYRGRPDLLEKSTGTSNYGDWVYIPVDIKSSSKAKPLHKQQLAFYCILLERIQGMFPESPFIVNGDFVRLEITIDDDILSETREKIIEIGQIIKGKRPVIHISSAIKQSPWYNECLREAEVRSDISLIYKLRKDTAQALRAYGIDTLEKMAVQDVDALPKMPGASIETLRRAKLQAQSLVEKNPIFIGQPETIQETKLTLYFDIEGDPWLETEYLFGFWIVGDPERKYARLGNISQSDKDNGKYFLYFIAETPDLESLMWENFLAWLRILPTDFRVYHYAHYEKTTLKKLSEKYRSSEELQYFQNHLVDLQKHVEKSMIFPLYFYSIKDIAKSPFMNFKWRNAKASGGQSIFWYEQWLETKDKQMLQDIIDYNEDDVRATEHLHIWINDISKKNPSMV